MNVVFFPKSGIWIEAVTFPKHTSYGIISWRTILLSKTVHCLNDGAIKFPDKQIGSAFSDSVFWKRDGKFGVLNCLLKEFISFLYLSEILVVEQIEATPQVNNGTKRSWFGNRWICFLRQRLGKLQCSGGAVFPKVYTVA